MKKIPTLFIREFHENGSFTLTDRVSPGMEWVLRGEGDATIKYDGACCAFFNGRYYKRYDAKRGKNGEFKAPPPGAIPCCDPDPITGHWPHWVPVDKDKPEDKWFLDARGNGFYSDGTYEAVGLHFNGNPYNLDFDALFEHGSYIVEVERSFNGIKDYLEEHIIEGLVFWKDNEPQCKIKRSDFGFKWPIG